MRYSSIDLLRSAAIVVMVVVHFSENLAGYTPGIAGFGAPMFMFLSGVSYRLWLNGQLARRRMESEISKVSIRRGMFLFGLGFAFNILVWSPEDAFNWDILTLIGCGLIVLSLIRYVRPAVVVMICAALVIMGPIAQQLADGSAYWTDGYFDPDPTFSDVVQGFFVVGYFPVIPWLAFPMIGFLVATRIFGPDNISQQSKVGSVELNRLIKTAGGLICFTTILILSRNFAPETLLGHLPQAWTMFPPSFEYTVGIMGLTLLIFVLAHRWIDLRIAPDRLERVKRLAAIFGKYSLSFYLLHHLAHLWPLWIYGVTYGEHPHDFWGKATTVPVSLACALIFLVISFILFRWVDRNDWPTVEKLMRWICD